MSVVIVVVVVGFRILDPGSRILDPGSRIQDPGPRTKKYKKNGNGQEKDKYPTKSDENLPIWSQTGQENLSRRVPDPKNARGVVKNEGVQVAVTFWRKGGV